MQLRVKANGCVRRHGYLRDVRVFQSQSGQVQHAHCCPPTDEDEEGDELLR